LRGIFKKNTVVSKIRLITDLTDRWKKAKIKKTLMQVDVKKRQKKC